MQDKSYHFKKYVNNRVTQTLESTSASDWNFIKGIKVSADICPRKLFNPNLLCKTAMHGKNWLSGPTFLHENEECWQIEIVKCLDQNDAEIRQAETLVGVSTIKNDLIDGQKYSSWQRIIRVMGFQEYFILV